MSYDPEKARLTNKFLSKDDCAILEQRIFGMAVGGGVTDITIESHWTGEIRWARNEIISSGDIQDNDIAIFRNIRGAGAGFAGGARTNQIDDVALEATIRRAERLIVQDMEDPDWSRKTPYAEPYLTPTLWFDRTYQLGAAERASAMKRLVEPAMQAGLLSAGYIEVSAHGASFRNTRGRAIYYPYTCAQYSVTVRDPDGIGSGWAGVDWNDWGRVDAEKLSAIALNKCLQSRNPVAVEPGRYMTILEPQAVSDFVGQFMRDSDIWDRYLAEEGSVPVPFMGTRRGATKIGERVVDERITITANPMDPDCGFFPFQVNADGLAAYRPVTWIDRGVLTSLSYDHRYAVERLLENQSLSNSGAFRIDGGNTSVDDMIATTKRGILVTRFWGVTLTDRYSVTMSGYTRDGLWLIENGKVGQAIKNFRFTESVLAVLNNVTALGPAQRVFHPTAPAVVPPMQIREFNFDALVDVI